MSRHRSNKINGRNCRQGLHSLLLTNELIQMTMVRYLLRPLFHCAAVRKGQSWNLLSNKTNQTVKSAAHYQDHNEIKFNKTISPTL